MCTKKKFMCANRKVMYASEEVFYTGNEWFRTNRKKEQEDSIANRDIATENRVNLANAIYDEMVKICNTGKRMWESVDAARYNDYIIYDTPSGSADKTAPTAQVI